MKHAGVESLLVFLLLFMQLLFQFHLFTLAFVIVLILLVLVAFMNEQNRLFIWTIIGFVVGEFAFIYGDRLLIELSLSHIDVFIFNRVLLLFPIIIISYIVYKFKGKVISDTGKPDWNQFTKIPFIWWGKKFTIRTLFLLIPPFVLIFLFFNIGNSLPMSPVLFGKILLFAIVNGLLIEFLWRGLLLTRIRLLIGEKFAVIVTSLSCAMAHYFFGFSLNLSLIIFILGIYLGGLTVHSKSLLPAVVGNILFTIYLIFSDEILLLTI